VNHVKHVTVELLMLLLLLHLGPGLCSGKTNAGFTAQELAWIKAHPSLRLAVSGVPAPISFWGDATAPIPPLPAGEQHPAQRDTLDRYPHNSEEQRQNNPVPSDHKPLISYYRGSSLPSGQLELQRKQDDLIYVSKAQQDMFKGVAADYLQEITAITGIRFHVVLAAQHNHQALHEALINGQADIIPSVILGNSPSDHPELFRSHAYIEVPVVIVTRKETAYIDDLETLKAMRVAGVLSIESKWAQLGGFTRLTHIGPEEGLRGVATGKYDAFICELTGVSMALADMPLPNIKISGELPFPSKFALDASQQIKDFIPIFNKALAAIPQERKNAIWEKWFRIDYEKKMISSLWVQTVLIGAGLLTICALAIVFFVQRRFKRIKMAVEALDPHLLSVRMDQNVIITEVTEAFCRVTGFDCKDLIGQPLMSLGSPAEDSPNAFNQIWKTLQKGNHWQGEVKLLKKDGSIMWVEAVVSPLRRENDKNDGYTAIYQDVSERKYFENLAVRDELTGLFNRRHFNEVGPVLLRRAQDERGIFALILMDVDNFKKYNDNYGHPKGDRVLSDIGGELRRVFQRHDDMVFRMGGEEFGAVVVMSHPDDVVLCTQKILSCIRGLNILHKYNPPGIVTVSIGVCTTKDFTDHDIGRIYQIADEALYQAKSAGRNQVCLKNG